MFKYHLYTPTILFCSLLLLISCRKSIERTKKDDVTTGIKQAKPHNLEIQSTDAFSLERLLYQNILSPTSSRTLRRKNYISSYNCKHLTPNWVSWHLTAVHVDGDVPRDHSYYEDEDVPIPRATNEDYRGSGWSRGHMCPAGDNKWDVKAMQESNLLTNICPQDRGLNSGMWNKIEQDCRRWAKKYGDIYIVCGPIYLNREHETIGVNKVVVPEAFFKVILCLQGKPKAIGYIVRNNGGTKKRDMYVNTVDDVERITGIDFFPALPDSIENVVEAYANLEDW